MAKHFPVGSIVTLKSHPLFFKHTIDVFTNQVPPLMVVKDVFFEDKKKKIFSDEVDNVRIADSIKYTCVFFNNNRGEFVEVSVYHKLLKSYKYLKYYRKLDDKGKETKSPVTLIDEVELYSLSNYEFGKPICFKTDKLERRKRFVGNKDNTVKISFTSPKFIISGFKKEKTTDLYYGNGDPKRKVSETFYKVTWYNHFQQKFSEQYLPQEFFVDNFSLPKVDDTDVTEILETNPTQNDSEVADFDNGSH